MGVCTYGHQFTKKTEQILFCSVNPYSNLTYSVYKRPTYIGGLSLMPRQSETL